MTNTLQASKHASLRFTALHDITVAGDALRTAKKSRSAESIARAEQKLKPAIDCARDLDVEWSPIGRALGIARGNAYQQYRTRPQPGSGVARRT